jgi:hypothetical protein
MGITQNKLHILGKVSSVIFKKIPAQHNINKENAIWLFAGYSFSEHKVNESFDIFIKESDQSWNHDYKLKLKKIYDEFGRGYTSIPEGYKTICLFDCAPSVPAYIKNLPTLKTWEVTPQSIYLCNHADIDLLHNNLYDSVLFDTFSKMLISSLLRQDKTNYTMHDITSVLPDGTPQIIIDNLFLSGAIRKENGAFVLAK